ncbi:MAG: hypothetical protein HYY13_01745 [Nitrospirae bacterium]|nr:hypothetical protein [Nitrospirota bacterium]
MATRKRPRTVHAPKSAASPEAEESKGGLVRSLADGAFDVAETVSKKVDEAADKILCRVEEVTGAKVDPARRIYESISKVRNRSLATAKEQTQKWVETVSGIANDFLK